MPVMGAPGGGLWLAHLASYTRIGAAVLCDRQHCENDQLRSPQRPALESMKPMDEVSLSRNEPQGSGIRSEIMSDKLTLGISSRGV